MTSIQVKHVPENVHAALRQRAAQAGQSMQDYLLDHLTEPALKPTLDEVLDRAGGRSGGRVAMEDAVDAVRADRDGR